VVMGTGGIGQGKPLARLRVNAQGWVCIMEGREKRKSRRLESLNLLSYACLDEKGDTVHQAMAKTINISESGIRMETHVPLVPRTSVSLMIGLKEDLLDITGKVAHCEVTETAKFHSGIHFFDMTEKQRALLREYVEAMENR